MRLTANMKRIIACVLTVLLVLGLVQIPSVRAKASAEEYASETDATEAVSSDETSDEIDDVTAVDEDVVQDDSKENEDIKDASDIDEDEASDADEDEASDEADEMVPFSKDATVEGVNIRVTADKGVFPAGSTLSVSRISDEEAVAEGVTAAVDSKRSSDKNVAMSYTFDITIYDKDGNEIEPDTSKGEVKVSFTSPRIGDSNLDTDIYHIEGSSGRVVAKELTGVTEFGYTATAKTDGFSYYTVEFTYGELQYVLNGDENVPLFDILNEVGLSGNVSNVEVSNEELFTADNESGEWIVSALQAFRSDEWMKVTIGGTTYEIVVTDAVVPDTATAWTSTNSLPSSSGTYYLMNCVFLDNCSSWNVPENVTLYLNNHNIICENTFFNIQDDRKLTIYGGGNIFNDYAWGIAFLYGMGELNIYDDVHFYSKGTLIDSSLSGTHPSSNYSLADYEAAKTIDASDISVGIGDTSKTIGATSVGSLSYSVTDTSIISVDVNGKITPKKAGHTTVKIIADESGTYHSFCKNITVTVERATVTVTADALSKTYGDADPKLTATVTGLKGDDTEAVLTYELSRKEGEDVGTYVITPSGEAVQGNYNVEYETAELTIKKKPITITADDVEKFYGEEDPEFTYTLSEDTPLAEGDDLEDVVTLTLTREDGEASGEYAITAEAIESDNYDVTFIDGALTINKYPDATFELDKKEDVPDVTIDKTDEEMIDMALTDEEKDMVKDGAGVTVFFEIKNAELSDAERVKINAAAGDAYKIGAAYDISLFKKFAHLKTPEAIHHISSPVNFCFALSDELTNVPEGYTREFKVVTIHNDQAKVLGSKIDLEKKTGSFDADDFSLFAITYKDTPIAKETVDKKTGDESPVIPVAILMMMSIAGITFIIRRKKHTVR